jgi:ElaB/YqjD/DUF883 family membrane-anchored ribosome-binding protein
MNKHATETIHDTSELAEQGRAFAGKLRDQAVVRTKAADKTIRGHPYKAIGIALGIGAVLGWLLARRSPKGD